MRRPAVRACVVLVAAAMALPAAFAQAPRSARAPATGNDPYARCLHVARSTLTGDAQATLRRIPDPERRLLALRGYLRADDLAGRWSWTAEQVRAWERSPEHAEAMRELAKVQQRFGALNPGYRLHVNTDVRTLDTQVERWNDNASVGRAAHGLAAPAQRACADAGPDAFTGWLRASTLSTPANLAVPGLSPHGQARAFDFQVFAGDVLVAGTDSTRIAADWRDGGWAGRLAEAIKASKAFEGPLQTPNEPWHYAYLPE